MLLSLINFVQHINKSGEGHQQACPSCALPVAFFIRRTSSLVSRGRKENL